MLPVAVFVCLGWIASVCLHEFGHAIVAYWGGDTSVKDKGYLTLNPIKYLDPVGSIIVPTIFLLLGGIALPGAAVYINHKQLHNRWWETAVSAAGPMATILVTLLLAIPFRFGLVPIESKAWIWPALAFLITLEISAVILNLLPIPSLDGYGMIEPWLPEKIRMPLRKFGTSGFYVLFFLLWFVPALNQFFWNAVFTLSEILGVSQDLASQGYLLFQAWAGILLVVTIIIYLLIRNLISPYSVWYERGNSFIKYRQYQRAIAAYDRAIKIKADYPEAWSMRGYTLIQLQRYPEAIAAYQQAVAIKPDNYEAWYNLGLCFEQLERYEDAIAAYDRGIEIKSNEYQALHRKGWSLAQLKRYEEAIYAYDRAIDLEPGDSSLWSNRGVALGELGQYEEAIASCEKAIQIKPSDPYAWYNKAGCYALQGNVDLTIENLQQAIHINANKFKDYASHDSSFDLVRDHPLFQELIE